MTKQTEAMKLALEALQEVYLGSRSAKHDEAITALREALAEQPAQQELCPSCRNGSIYACTCTFKPAPVQQETVAVELVGVEEAIKEGGGFWKSCTGCYETNEGHPPTGAFFSPVFKCHMGRGCSECAGIGAIWDDTDYEAMADHMMNFDAPQPAQQRHISYVCPQCYWSLDEQPAPVQQEPIGKAHLCDRCSTPFDGEDECPQCGHGSATKKAVYTSPPAQRKPLTEWVPLTQKLLNEQHEWLYEPMWIAMKDGSVLQGYYEWRQGWNPDRLLADGGDHWAFDAAYVMPIVKPTPPAIEAAHGIKEST